MIIMKRAFIAATLISLGAFGSVNTADAADKYTMKLNDQEYRAQSTIPLKALLKQHYPNLILRDAELVRVQLVAKSQVGQGWVDLMVGQRVQSSANISGRASDYGSSRARSFDKIKLESRDTNYNSSNEAWQLVLQGSIKVRKIVVVLENNRPRQNALRDYQLLSIGEGKADKVRSSTESFNGHSQVSTVVVIRGIDSTLEITQVTVQYLNGSSEVLGELEGRISDDQYRVAILDKSRVIRSVTVSAVSRSLMGSRGEYEVLIGQRR